MKELIFEELNDSAQKAISSLEKALGKVRTGRASLALLDGIKVEYYGTPTLLNQVATLSVPESRLIVIAPWDATAIGAIEKAIQKSELGLMPSSDGKVVRILIPVLTESRRKDLVKVVKKMAEECKIALRGVRRLANDEFKELKKNGEVTEDEFHDCQDKVQKITDKFMEQVDHVLQKKEKEIMEI